MLIFSQILDDNGCVEGVAGPALVEGMVAVVGLTGTVFVRLVAAVFLCEAMVAKTGAVVAGRISGPP